MLEPCGGSSDPESHMSLGLYLFHPTVHVAVVCGVKEPFLITAPMREEAYPYLSGWFSWVEILMSL